MITSLNNQEIKNVIALMKKSSLRYEKKLYVVEGTKMFFEIPKKDLVKAYMTDDFYIRYKGQLAGYDYELVSDAVFDKMADTKTPQGVIALVRMKEYELSDIIGEEPLIMILDDLQDPGNLGTIIRSLEGAGGSGLLLSPDCVDLYNPKVVRSTMGSIFRMKCVNSKDLIADILKLKIKGIDVYAACLDDSTNYTELDLDKPCAFVIGNESKGVRQDVIAASSGKVKIPMKGKVESLNASIAATLLLYESSRQRA